MKRATEVMWFATVILSTAVLLVQAAPATEEPLPCQAAKVMAQARYFRCLAPCESASPTRLDDCQRACQKRFDHRMESVDRQPVCGGDPPAPANPNQCNAFLLQAEAHEITCRFSCDRHSAVDPQYDEAACLDKCAGHREKTSQHIMSLPFCKDVNGVLTLP